jgi:tRNA pseudouridine38-40 synthase
MNDMTDLDELEKAIQVFKGKHDFTTFTVEAYKYDDPVREILDTRIVRFGPLVGFYFLGTGFLYKMVRSMAGALMFVGRGRLKADDIKEMLEAKNRLRCKDTAPAKGLFLKRVFYEGDSWENDLPDRPPFWMY